MVVHSAAQRVEQTAATSVGQMVVLMVVLSVDQMVDLTGIQTVGSKVVQKDTEWDTLTVDSKAACLASKKVGPTAARSDSWRAS